MISSSSEPNKDVGRAVSSVHTYPKEFKDYNVSLFQPGGFYRGNDANERVWNTDEKKAVFTAPRQLNALSFGDADGRFRLLTIRSNDQFNTTIYGYSDRFRGIEGTRDIVLMSRSDIDMAGLAEGQIVTLVSDFGDGMLQARWAIGEGA